MSNVNFDELIEKMPGIANAVNAFTSDSVQELAFQALLRSFAGDIGEPSEASASERRHGKPKPRGATEGGAAATEGKPVRKRRSLTPAFVRDLNLRPNDKPSFKDFAAAKSPEANDERNALCIYWLTRIADLGGVTVDHIYTCFKEAKWKVPPNLANSLAVTANRKGWINTEDTRDLRVTVSGENLIEHDLPRKEPSS